MFKPRHLIAVFLATIPLMGMQCAGTQWNVKGECKTSGSGSGDCTISGGMSGTFLRGATLADRLLSLDEIIDAADFSIDVSQSTVVVPSRGTVSITLVDRSDGTIQSARVFPWVRSGTRLILSDPDAVNTWAAQTGGVANKIDYELLPFTTSETFGLNTLSSKAVYAGEVLAASTTTWRGQVCPNDPLTPMCQSRTARHCQ